MPYPQLDRSRVQMKPLSERQNKLRIEVDHVPVTAEPATLDAESVAVIDIIATRIVGARDAGKPVMIGFGAHTIKNGLGPVLIQLMDDGWLTHLATNGAGVIHDWEFSFLGESSEDVRHYVEQGQFGNWEETGFYINLAINVGAYEGKGYGESVGALIETGGLTIPDEDQLRSDIVGEDFRLAAAAADLLAIVRQFKLQPGRLELDHPWRRFSVQAAACRLGIPFTSHPMFGHDIIYNHPMSCGPLLGRAAERDFLTFAEGVSRLDGGVYLSVGSAVMSPMIFEKSMSMSQNLAIQEGRHLDNHFIAVVDLAKSRWDWNAGEPPQDRAEYYLRYNKTFSRMGGMMKYLQADNRDFLLALLQRLQSSG